MLDAYIYDGLRSPVGRYGGNAAPLITLRLSLRIRASQFFPPTIF